MQLYNICIYTKGNEMYQHIHYTPAFKTKSSKKGLIR